MYTNAFHMKLTLEKLDWKTLIPVDPPSILQFVNASTRLSWSFKAIVVD